MWTEKEKYFFRARSFSAEICAGYCPTEVMNFGLPITLNVGGVK